MKKLLFTYLSIFGICLLTFAGFFGCSNKEQIEVAGNNPNIFHQSVEKLTDVIVHDIFSPPVASRIYAYATIAAYETLIHENPQYRSFVGQLNGLQNLPQPDANKQYDLSFASVHAFLTVSKALIFSEGQIEEYQTRLYDSVYASIPEEIYQNSVQFGEKVAHAVLDYSKKDNYSQTRGLKYTVLNEPGTWSPTPPAYMDAIEPYWNKIRPFVLDSANQFMPDKPVAFSMDKESSFYKDAFQVYETVKNLTKEQREIASFWDCNPFVMHTVGHVMYATKKITPGGHWMGITLIANKKANADMMQSLEAYTLVAIALSDGFISCWDEKYRSHVIRPETVINAHIDDKWAPVLQTPPFPEYPSGHSVISRAASVVLTKLYGDNFNYVDSTEIKYGLPSRTFNSFKEAAEEAAISRLYGGIHYMPAITQGMKEGEEVGKKVIADIKTRKDADGEMLSSTDN